jgi:hypothetical protein
MSTNAEQAERVTTHFNTLTTKQRHFLEYLATGAAKNDVEARRMANISGTSLSNWRKNDANFNLVYQNVKSADPSEHLITRQGQLMEISAIALTKIQAYITEDFEKDEDRAEQAKFALSFIKEIRAGGSKYGKPGGEGKKPLTSQEEAAALTQKVMGMNGAQGG